MRLAKGSPRSKGRPHKPVIHILDRPFQGSGGAKLSTQPLHRQDQRWVWLLCSQRGIAQRIYPNGLIIGSCGVFQWQTYHYCFGSPGRAMAAGIFQSLTECSKCMSSYLGANLSALIRRTLQSDVGQHSRARAVDFEMIAKSFGLSAALFRTETGQIVITC